MNNLATWFIWSSIALMLFVLIYKLLLNRISLLKTGRLYLMLTLLMAVIIPLPWQSIISTANEIAFIVNLDMPVIFPETDAVQSSWNINWTLLLILAYSIPAVALLLFLFISNLRVWLLICRSEVVIVNHTKVYGTGQNTLPFSWFGRIVVSLKDIKSQHFKSILAHEQAHVRQYHFIDLLVVELAAIVLWFNPAVWFYRSAIRDVHEYLADRATVNNGFNIPEYQRLLAGLTGLVPAGVLSNNMKHSLLKNRLIMMTKTKSGKFEPVRLTIAMIITLLIGWGVFATACKPKVEKEQTQIEEPAQIEAEPPPPPPLPEEEIFTVVEEMPAFPGGNEARIKYMIENIRYPEEARKKGIEGRVFVTFVVEANGSVTNAKILRGIGGGCDEEAIRIVEAMPVWEPGKQRGEPVRVQFNMPIMFALSD